MTGCGQGILTIDLGAITANWHALSGRAPSARAAAAVKSDGYGLGIVPVGRALADAGCDTFFVATAGEGVSLREALGEGPVIYVLNGFDPACAANGLRAVVNSLEELTEVGAAVAGATIALQLDSGMSRLGLARAEIDALCADPGVLSKVDVALIMSHLANADMPDDAMNAAQLASFSADLARLRALPALRGARASLSATGGILLGPDYHFDLVRAGVGLYGGLPFAEAKPVVSLKVPILTVRDIPAGGAVGYGATFRTTRPSRIATISAGYGDGLPRALSNRGAAYLDRQRLPFAGRVSMDLIGLDVTDAPGAVRGAMVTLLGEVQGVDAMARDAGTIGYEILTALGSRYKRRYKHTTPTS